MSTMARARWLAGAALIAACAACPACGDEVDSRPAEWPYIVQAIIRPNCATAGCHSTFTHAGGLVFEDAHGAHVLLVGYAGDGAYVTAGDPVKSKLMYLLRGKDTWRMPPDQPLADADIDLIENWIRQGATEEPPL